MIVNFRAREISRGARKLARTYMLIIKKILTLKTNKYKYEISRFRIELAVMK